jgi:hypothetical protein
MTLLNQPKSPNVPNKPVGEDDKPDQEPHIPDPIVFRVSSDRLQYLPGYFGAMFSKRNKWVETQKFENGMRRVKATGHNPRALEHFLNIAHGNEANLPSKITLQELMHIAFITDYYGLHDLITPQAATWLLVLRPRSDIFDELHYLRASPESSQAEPEREISRKTEAMWWLALGWQFKQRLPFNVASGIIAQSVKGILDPSGWELVDTIFREYSSTCSR